MFNKEIKTIENAREFIQFLIKKDLMFHLDDDVDNILWDQEIDKKTIKLLHLRHQEMWTIGSPWEYAEDIIDTFLGGLQ
tara:strand:+ start:42 stop:278 length:237 start_codon:yes stop_codon:yes gene_type:complete